MEPETTRAGGSFEGQLVGRLPPQMNSIAWCKAGGVARHFGDRKLAIVETCFDVQAISKEGGMHHGGRMRADLLIRSLLCDAGYFGPDAYVVNPIHCA